MNNTASAIEVEQAIEFNDQLLAFCKLGIPVDVGLGHGESLRNRLGELQTEFASKKTRHQRIEFRALAQQVSYEYAAALFGWVNAKDRSLILDSISNRHDESARLSAEINRLLFYPIIICVLALLAFVGFCVFIVPMIRGMYDQISEPPSDVAASLIWANETIHVWLPIVIFVLAFAVLVLWRSLAGSRLLRFPGSRRFVQMHSQANKADALATMLDGGLATAELDAIFAKQNQRSPLIAWAMSDTPTESRSVKLRFVARTYRSLAGQQSRGWWIVIPSITGLLIGGAIVLLYGASMFGVVSELLVLVSKPGAS